MAIVNSYDGCPWAFNYPSFQGMCKSTADYTFSSWEANIDTLDFNENYMVMAGNIETSGRKSFFPADDVQEVLCESTNCN